ncbi:hypothetical protein GGD66_000598 [Bradyrhizobium sp. CIR48]|nr:hypothetical protein [Bradyrhizobium sp. CIR48]
MSVAGTLPAAAIVAAPVADRAAIPHQADLLQASARGEPHNEKAPAMPGL